MKERNFHLNLASRRRELHLTQEQLARRMNVSPQAVSKWEKTSFPDAEQLPRLADALDISLDRLFGLREPGTDADPIQAVSRMLQSLPESERPALIARLCYAAVCAYNPSAVGETGRLRSSYENETFALLHTDREIAMQRLNADLRYFLYLEKPEQGIADYLRDDAGTVRLFATLSDEAALRIVKYMAGSCRNKLFLPEKLAERLGIAPQKVQQIINRLDRLGLVWRMAADLGDDKPVIMYGFTHNPALAGILVLAESICRYLQNADPHIDTFTYGTLQDRTTGNPDSVPQVSTWDTDQI